MAFLDETYCQLYERFITIEQWNQHLYSSGHLHREVNCYWPAYFTQRKLTADEGSILEKSFWKMFFATRHITEVEEFWLRKFRMTTNLRNYIREYKEELRKVFRDTIEVHFEHDLYKKSISNQVESDETDTLQQRIEL